MKKKLMLIISFLISPKLLILDEPINGLDPKSILKFEHYIKEYRDSGGAALISTHLLDYAEKFCSRVYMIKEGNIVYNGNIHEGTLENIYRGYQNE